MTKISSSQVAVDLLLSCDEADYRPLPVRSVTTCYLHLAARKQEP